MKDKYFVIFHDGDGELHIHQYDSAEDVVEEFIPDGEDEEPSELWRNEVPEYADGEAFILIIKGRIVVPKPKMFVTKWELSE